MAPARSFDYERLKLLMVAHPDWEYDRYADALTRELREGYTDSTGSPVEGDRDAPHVMPNAVAQVIRRYRAAWADQGIEVQKRAFQGALPWSGIPDRYARATLFRRLRTLHRIAEGRDAGMPHSERNPALALEAELRRERRVVDIRDTGEPYIRDARPDEVVNGRLIKLTADPGPEWSGKARRSREAGQRGRVTEMEQRGSRESGGRTNGTTGRA